MAYAFPEEYDKFFDCVEKSTDPAEQDKCGPLLAAVNNQVLNELQERQKNSNPLNEAEMKAFEKCFNEHGEDGLVSCALAGETSLVQRFEQCLASNKDDVTKCEQQGADVYVAAGKFLKRAGVQL